MAATKKAPTGKSRASQKSKSTATPKKRAVSRATKKVRTQKSKTPAKKKTTKQTKSTKIQKKPAKKLKPARKDTLLKGGGTLSFPRSISLSIFNPVLLPATPDQLAAGTARFAGLFFVIVGAFFATYHSLAVFHPTLFNAHLQSASVVDVCDKTSTTYDPIDPLCLNSSKDAPSERKLNVAFVVKSGIPLAGTVPIHISVEQADKVRVKVYKKSTGDFYDIGYAKKQENNSEWRISWQTENFVDDAYKLYAIVTNRYGTYEKHSDTYYEVENISNTQTIDSEVTAVHMDGTSTLPVSDSVTDALISTPDIGRVVVNKSNPVSGYVLFSAYVDDATEVKLKATHAKTLKEYLLGAATQTVAGKWVVSFTSTAIPDGQYTAMIIAKNKEGVLDRKEVSLVVKNNIDQTSVPMDKHSGVASGTAQATPADLAPEVDIELTASNGATISEFATFTVEAKDASFVEVYMVPQYSNMRKFVGLAKKVSANLWTHRFDTTQLPNGTYRLFVRIKNQYGLFDSNHVTVTVANSSETDTKKPEESAKPNDVVTSVPQHTKPTTHIRTEPQPLLDKSDTTARVDDSRVEAGSEDVPVIESRDQTRPLLAHTDDIVEDLGEAFQQKLERLLNRLAAALRSENVEAVTETKKEIKKLREEIYNAALSPEETEKMLTRIDNRLEEAVLRVEEDVVKTEKIVRERTGESASKDSDGDGVTDFDEVNIYKTDPLAADSDNDGFIDGAEILRGFDPNNATPEVLVAYESPKKTGVVRDDILKIEKVISISEPEEDRDGVNGQALFMGTALPNSYVTIYIFSTPVIVTVKSDNEGNWEYQFDKELEDGSHEVYVGVTDNAGKIVAKSEPLLFIKEAQAFTPVDAESAAVSAVTQTSDSDSLVSSTMMLIIASISVVSIGLVLILIGVRISRKEENQFLMNQSSSAPV